MALAIRAPATVQLLQRGLKATGVRGRAIALSPQFGPLRNIRVSSRTSSKSPTEPRLPDIETTKEEDHHTSALPFFMKISGGMLPLGLLQRKKKQKVKGLVDKVGWATKRKSPF